MGKRVVVIGVLITAALSAGSQELTVEPFPRVWGAGVDLQYGDLTAGRGTSTTVRGVFSAAYTSEGYFRYSDESLFSGEAGSNHEELTPSFNSINGDWLVGLEQGLLYGPGFAGPGSGNGRDRDLLSLFGYVRGRADSHVVSNEDKQLVYRSNKPDEAGIVQNSVVAGLFSDMVTESSPGRTRTGYYAELSAEWAPERFLNTAVGRADFHRYSARLHGFIPLASSSGQSLDLYAAAQSIVDVAFGDYLPINVLQSFGGREIEDGLGGTVRGLSSGRFDASFKAAQNVELRLVLPPFWNGRVVPGVVSYVDAGYYNDLQNRSPQADENSGTSLSAGVGLSTRLFGLATLVFYTHYLIGETRISGRSWTPFGIGFGYHF